MKLSVAIICKNEEAVIEDCLKSVQGADEIVVSDTGSEDNTVEIVKRYTDKVYTDYKWNDNFAEARNHVLSKCTGDWILSIDADETLEAGGIEKIRQLIKATDKRVFSFKLISSCNKATHRLARLFKREGANWQGVGHEHINFTESNYADIQITYGYSPAHNLDKDRMLRIMQKAMRETPNGRNAYYLGREYYYRKDYITALWWLNKCIEMSKWDSEISEAYLMASKCYWFSFEGNKAREMCLYAIKFNPMFKEALQFMAELHYEPHKSKWLKLSEGADNTGVLFNRIVQKTHNRVLVATNHLNTLGGTETYTYALVKELVRLGFGVDVFTLNPGHMSERIAKFANVVTNPNPEYDVILINHGPTLERLAHIKGYKIFTSHGIFPDLEKVKEGADEYIAISEEVADTIPNSRIIRNGIDCDRFKPTKPLNKKPKVLSMCQGTEAREMVERACKELDYEFAWVERNFYDIENKINEADIVVTLGRGAMEAMSCGRAVFVFDSRPYMGAKGDGWITKDNWQQLAKNNFSGRATNKKYTIEDLKEELKQYSTEMNNRDVVLEHFNIQKQVQEYHPLFKLEHITIVIPNTEERRNRADTLLQSIKENTNYPNYSVKVFYNELGGWVPAVHEAIKDIDGYVVLLGSDVVVKKNWLTTLVARFFEKFPNGDGAVQPFDEINNGALCQHPLAHTDTIRKYLDKRFIHNFSDNWMTEMLKKEDKYLYVPESKIEHRHWVNNKAEKDTTYETVMSTYEQDKETYNQLKKEYAI